MKSIYFCHIRWFCHGLVGFSLSATPDLNSPRNPSAHIDNDQLVQVNSICLHVTPLSKKKHYLENHHPKWTQCHIIGTPLIQSSVPVQLIK